MDLGGKTDMDLGGKTDMDLGGKTDVDLGGKPFFFFKVTKQWLNRLGVTSTWTSAPFNRFIIFGSGFRALAVILVLDFILEL